MMWFSEKSRVLEPLKICVYFVLFCAVIFQTKAQLLYEIDWKNCSYPYQWGEVRVLNAHLCQPHKFTAGDEQYPATAMVPQPVLVSLTSVSFRIARIESALLTILHGTVRPTAMYLFVSKEPHLLDEGITQLPQYLLEMVAAQVLHIVFTDNMGPHRKLLPLLRRFYERDVLIANIDDDMVYLPSSSLLYNLLRTYQQSNGTAVVALRSRRIGLCIPPPHSTTRYFTWSVLYSPGRIEMLTLPTGTGGVLYRPRFFHPVVFNRRLLNITSTADDIMFRLSCLARHVPVAIGCRDLERDGVIIKRCPVDVSLLNASLKQGTAPGGYELAAARRMLLHSATHGTDSSERQLRPSLYSVNKRGRNDRQWLASIQFLHDLGILNMNEMIRTHFYEREYDCYNASAPNGRSMKRSLACSLFECSAANEVN